MNYFRRIILKFLFPEGTPTIKKEESPPLKENVTNPVKFFEAYSKEELFNKSKDVTEFLNKAQQ